MVETYYHALLVLLSLCLILELAVSIMSVVLATRSLYLPDDEDKGDTPPLENGTRYNAGRIAPSPLEEDPAAGIPNGGDLISKADTNRKSTRGNALRRVNYAVQVMAGILAIFLLIKTSLQGGAVPLNPLPASPATNTTSI